MNPTDNNTEGVWLTKAEIASVRRISVASADRLIRRKCWRKQLGNDGRARVLVPTDWASSEARSPTDRPPLNRTDKQSVPTDEPNVPTDRNCEVRILADHVTTLREQLERERSRADASEAARVTTEVRADAALVQRDALASDLVAAQAARIAAEVVAEALRQQQVARKAKPLAARILAALRGD